MPELRARLEAALAGRYTIERELGRGGMGTVFLARDWKHHRCVAVKVLNPAVAAAIGCERFLREIEIAATLTHPHILPLLDSGGAEGLLYYVMPHVAGESLRDRLKRETTLPIEEALRVTREVADGLAHAHDHGVVHRDVKPENILFESGHAVITDFGTALPVTAPGGERGSGERITEEGIAVGTPAYMSPEQAMAQPVDGRSDIYALGCVLYEMLVGEPPHAGRMPQPIIGRGLRHHLPSLHAIRNGVPASVEEAVHKALAQTPADRYRTAAEFARALEPEATNGRGRRQLRRAALLGSAAALVASLLAAFLLRARHEPTPSANRLHVVVRSLNGRNDPLAVVAGRIVSALTERLEALPSLAVTAAGVVAELGNAGLDILRTRFHPDRVVLVGVRQDGDTMRVSADIVDARTGTVLAHRAVAAADSSALVAESLSEFVRSAFWAELDSAQRRARVGDPSAWDLVSRARQLSNDAETAILLRLDRQGFHALDLADSLLGLARRADEGSDLIPVEQATIADRRAFMVEYLRQKLHDLPSALPDPVGERLRAIPELTRLIMRRHGPADAYYMRGRLWQGLHRELKGDSLLDRAIADYRSATDIDPHLVRAWKDLASAYRSAAFYLDALHATQRALDEDVFLLDGPELERARFDAALHAGRTATADSACRKGFSSFPGDPRFADCELHLWSRARRDAHLVPAAWTRVNALAVDSPDVQIPLRQLWVAELLARAGLGDSADRVAQRATMQTPATWQPLLLVEEVYLRTLRHDTDSALALAAAAVRLDPTLRRIFRSDASYRPLQADPRLEAALAVR